MVDINRFAAALRKMQCIAYVEVRDDIASFRYLSIKVSLPELQEPIPFDVYIDPWYPAKACGSESIHFINKSLIQYPHIMEDGSLCLHTASSPDWSEKLLSDINQLCQWIRDYYIGKKKDAHFEHLVVNEAVVNGNYFSFNYAQVSSPFTADEFGYVDYRALLDGSKNGKLIKNYIVTHFRSKSHGSESRKHMSQFSEWYNNIGDCLFAPYLMVGKIPGRYGKFIINNYLDLEPIVSQEQRRFVLEYARYIGKKRSRNQYFPLFIGYYIPNGKVAWNVALVDLSNFPTIGIAERNNGRKTGIWFSEFKDQPIQWAMTNDISPEYFFGRGSFSSAITRKRILIIGIGAIGSMVAQTLVRGGCKDVDLYDFDVKQPGNVCRSEYGFLCPTNDKMNDLASQLSQISPYVNVRTYKAQFDEYVKMSSQSSSEIKDTVRKSFMEHYDLIIDCTTDDDVMYAIEQLQLPIDVVNFSISNHAGTLVCAFSPSIYEFVRGVYRHSIENDVHDVFYPTGCWNPTFKATYSDIASKLQYALKKVIRMLSGMEHKQNFIVTEDQTGLHFQTW